MQTFPNSEVDIIDTTLLFSVKTLQYLLFTAMGLTCQMQVDQPSADAEKWQEIEQNTNISLSSYHSDIKACRYKYYIPCTGTREFPQISPQFLRLVRETCGNPAYYKVLIFMIPEYIFNKALSLSN